MTVPAILNAQASNATPWLAEVPVKNPDGSALDLSGYASFVMHVKTDALNPEPQLVPTVTLVSGGSHNILRVAHALDDDLAALVEGVYVYDIVGIIDGEPADLLLQGEITVTQGVTVAGA